eukprot:1737761-Pyramimonas_sp.AAC.1
MPMGESFRSVDFNEGDSVDGVVTNPSSGDFNNNSYVSGFDRDPHVEGCASDPSCGRIQSESFLWR